MITILKTVASVLLLAATAQSAAIPKSAPALVPRGSGKKGLCYNDVSLVEKFAGDASISWTYDWGAQGIGSVDGFEYVPMCWGEKFFSTWKSSASQAIANGASSLLAFNEPDMESQANMSPSQAAAYYKEYMNPFSGKASLGAPAVTNSEKPGQGLDWLNQFNQACNGECDIDFYAVHWYDSSGNVNYFKKYMGQVQEVAAGKPVWITEFAMINAPQEEQAKFIREVVPWIEDQDWIQRYAYFGVFDGMMIQGDQLSTSGEAYISV